MHEMSLLNSLMNRIHAVAEREGACRVVCVRVKLGPLAHISPEHLRGHFEHAARGSVAEGARLEIEETSSTTDANASSILLDSVEVED